MRLEAVPIRRLMRRVGRAAPVLSLLLLIASPAVLARGHTEMDLQHQAEIAGALGSVPLIIGSWAGSDVPVPTEAVQILRPNAILSRRYSRIGGPESVLLAIIHCGDVRDMLGHYPPICYPANGWTNDAEQSRVLRLEGHEGRRWPLRFYRFTRADRSAGQRVMCVLNAFILPDGRLATEVDMLEERAVKKAMSRQGVAQLQFVFEIESSPEACAEVAQDILSELPPALLERLGVSEIGWESEPRRGPNEEAPRLANGAAAHGRQASEGARDG